MFNFCLSCKRVEQTWWEKFTLDHFWVIKWVLFTSSNGFLRFNNKDWAQLEVPWNTIENYDTKIEAEKRPQLLSGFVCAYIPVAPGLNPKHTIYALNFIMWKGRKSTNTRSGLAHILKHVRDTPIQLKHGILLFSKIFFYKQTNDSCKGTFCSVQSVKKFKLGPKTTFSTFYKTFFWMQSRFPVN